MAATAKVKVKVAFRDRGNFAKVYNVGEVLTVDADRAAALIQRGFAEAVLVKSARSKSKASTEQQ